LLESVGEVSGSEKESVHDEEYYKLNAGSDNLSENDDENQNNPLTILLHQATQQNDPMENLLSQATQVPGQGISASLQGMAETRYIDVPQVVEENQNTTPGKHTRKRRSTPDNQNLRLGKRLRTTPARFAPSSRKTVRI